METIPAKIKNFIPHSVLRLALPTYHFLLAFLAAAVYGFASRRLTVIGVTGTKGKTTVVHLLHEILQAAGARAASVSSLRFRIGEMEEPNDLKMTMPGRFFLQRFLRRAVREQCGYVILEVTSQGIAQFRHRFIRFSGAVMTNLAPEHLEAHGGFESYLRAKLDLFWRIRKEGIAVINSGDPHARRFAAATAAHRLYYGGDGIASNGRRWRLADVAMNETGITFNLEGQEVRSSLPGVFNLCNILAAAALGLGRGAAPAKIAAGVARVSGVPGRMEFIQRAPFAVVVDYAHTPDSLRKVYTFLKESGSKLQRPSYGLICVLGSAGGGRDKWKRPEMGRIAAGFCGEIILTDEDPYDENPEAILDEIASGFSQIPNSIPDPVGDQIPNLRKVLDRREAIRAALRTARSGDIVIITGKGAEAWIMGPAGTKIAWDDRAVAREELGKLK